MKELLIEKFRDFIEILLVILCDALLVIITALVVYGIRIILESIFGTTIDNMDYTIYMVYMVSEIVLITVGILYSVLDITLLMKRIYFRITQRQSQ
ncbi:MAG: hypothetical protein V9F05_07245 [Chitinophagaceae bacterium]